MRGQTAMALGVAAALTFGGVASAQVRTGSRTQSGQMSPAGQRPATSSSSQSGTKLSASTSAFLKHAADGNMAEIQLAKVAEQKATNDQVKALAQKIEEDHTQGNSELTTLAGSVGVTLPSDVSSTHKAEMERLSKLSGSAFDRAYVDLMVKDHQKDISEYRQHGKAANTSVQQFVTRTLPVLQDHLQRAQAAQAALGGPAAGKTKSASPTGAPGRTGTTGSGMGTGR